MKIGRGQMYQRLYDAYRKAHPEKSGKSNQEDVNSLWNELSKADLPNLHRLATSKKTNSTLFKYLTSKSPQEIIEKNNVEQECNNNVIHEFRNNDGQTSEK